MISERNKNVDVVCFGGGDWWYHNRAHIDMQIMRRLARQGTLLYVNSIVIQKPRLGRNSKLGMKIKRKLKSILTGLKESGEGFWVFSPVTLPVHHINALRPLNEWFLRAQVKRVIRKLKIKNPLVWVACPGACDTAIRLPKSRMVLQRTDRWEEFPNVDKEVITTYDHKMKTHADLTVFVSEMLYQEEQSQCKEALFLDHGVDFDKFTLVNGNGHMPEDMTNVSRPVVGFFGGIDDHTFDMPFMNQVIDLLPEMSFVFVGKTSIDCSELIDRDNVWMLGQKSYDEIPHYGKTFDVAIMPWRQNRWIEACNPIKLKEYLALGKPVISRPFSELKKYHDVVYEATTAEEFAAAIRQSLVEDDAERISQRQEKVRPFSWDSKAEMILDRLY